MALLNISGTGTYGVIEAFNYDKTYRTIGFSVNVYSSSSKELMLFSRNFSLSCISDDLKALSITKTAPTEDDVEPNYYFVPKNAVGEWAGRGPCFAQFLGERKLDENGNSIPFSNISYLPFSPGQAVFCVEDGLHYRINSDGVAVREVKGSPAIWDKYFSAAVISGQDTNILKQCYTFIKDTGIFPSAVEA
jgi:hypothetical protein